ncbi:SRPBCC family protein [Brevibacterium litoralis]|uniref:SRPBCC family protein n=1 Tax=Brevibacterium litoralis TaxID=3138935 RepID=UPI0032EF189D
MPVTDIIKDPEALTLTIVADFAASRQRVWDAYADPRQIEKFWGPPTYPATFTRHDMFTGGRSEYYMTGPEGDMSSGFWEFLDVRAPEYFEVRDGFAGEDGAENPDMPSMRMVYSFEETAEGCRLTAVTHFGSLEQLEQLVEMGMIEGTRLAMGQIDAVLADLLSFAADIPTYTQHIGDTKARISRVIAGSVEDVWRAHHEADLLKQWLLGPDGWSMPSCTPPGEPGSTFRYDWAPDDGGEGFSIGGEVLESHAPYRIVHTERMEGPESTEGTAGTEGTQGETYNEVTFTPVPEGTLLVYVITYPDAATRKAALDTGMTDGMEAGYVRLETVLAG